MMMSIPEMEAMAKSVKRADKHGIAILPSLPKVIAVAFFLFAAPASAAEYAWVKKDSELTQNFAACLRAGKAFGETTQANNAILYRRAAYDKDSEEAEWEFYRKSDFQTLAFRTRCVGNLFLFEEQEEK